MSEANEARSGSQLEPVVKPVTGEPRPIEPLDVKPARNYLAEIRARAEKQRDIARNGALQATEHDCGDLASRRWTRFWAFDEVVNWLDELEADAERTLQIEHDAKFEVPA